MYKNAPNDGNRIGESRLYDLSAFKNIEEVAAAPVSPPAYEASRSVPEQTLKYKIEAEPDIERDVLNGAFQYIRKAKAYALERATQAISKYLISKSNLPMREEQTEQTVRLSVSGEEATKVAVANQVVTPVSQDNEAKQGADGFVKLAFSSADYDDPRIPDGLELVSRYVHKGIVIGRFRIKTDVVTEVSKLKRLVREKGIFSEEEVARAYNGDPPQSHAEAKLHKFVQKRPKHYGSKRLT